MRAVAIFIFLSLIGTGRAQPAGDSPAGASQQPIAWVDILSPANRSQTGDLVLDQTNILIVAGVNAAVRGQRGDSITVDIFADTNKLCSRVCEWQPGMRPDPHAHSFQPMIMSLSGFEHAEFDWRNAPLGGHVLAAHAYGSDGVSLFSAPLHVTVVSSDLTGSVGSP